MNIKNSSSLKNGSRVANCPLNLEICFSSCYWRSGNKCTFCSQQHQSQRRQKLISGYMFRHQPIYVRN